MRGKFLRSEGYFPGAADSDPDFGVHFNALTGKNVELQTMAAEPINTPLIIWYAGARSLSRHTPSACPSTRILLSMLCWRRRVYRGAATFCTPAARFSSTRASP